MKYSRFLVIIMRVFALCSLLIMLFKIKSVYDATGFAPVEMSLAAVFLLILAMSIDEYGYNCSRKDRTL